MLSVDFLSPTAGSAVQSRRPSVSFAGSTAVPPPADLTAALEAEVQSLQARVRTITDQKNREIGEWERRCHQAEALCAQKDRDTAEIQAQHAVELSKIRVAHVADIGVLKEQLRLEADKASMAAAAQNAEHLIHVEHVRRQMQIEQQAITDKMEQLKLELKRWQSAEDEKNSVIEAMKTAREADEQKLHLLEAQLQAAERAGNEIKSFGTKQNVKYDEQVTSLQSRITVLKTNVQQLYDTRLELEKKLIQLGKSSTALQAQLHEKTQLAANQENTIADLQARVAELETTVDEKTTEVGTLSQDLAEVRTTATMAAETIRTLQDELAREKEYAEGQRTTLLFEWELKLSDSEQTRDKIIKTETYRVEKETAERWEKRCADIERQLAIQMEHRKAAFELLTTEKESEYAQKLKTYELKLDADFAARLQVFEEAVQKGEKNRFIELLQQRLDMQTKESHDVETRWQRAMNELTQKLKECLLRNDELQNLLNETTARLREERTKADDETNDRIRLAEHHIKLKAQLDTELKDKEMRDAALAHREKMDAELFAQRTEFEEQIERLKGTISELHLKLGVAEGVMETLSKDHTPELLQQRKELEINALKAEHQLEIDAMTEAHGKEIEQLRESLHEQHVHTMGSNIEKIRKKHKQAVEEDSRIYRDETKLMKERHDFELKTLRSEAATRVRDLSKELELTKMAHEVELRLVRKTLDQEKREMQSQISYLEDQATRAEQQSLVFKQEGLLFEAAFEKRMLEFSDELRVKFSAEALDKIRASAVAFAEELNAKLVAQQQVFNEQLEVLKNDHWRVRSQLEDRVDELNATLLAAEQRYLNRDSRPEDLALITNMRARLVELEDQMCKASGDLSHMSRELQNREDVFQRMFTQATTYTSAERHIGPPPKPSLVTTAKIDHSQETLPVTITIDPKSQRSTLGIFGSSAVPPPKDPEAITGVRVRSFSISGAGQPSPMSSRRSTLAGDLATTTVRSRRGSGPVPPKQSWLLATDTKAAAEQAAAAANSVSAIQRPSTPPAPSAERPMSPARLLDPLPLIAFGSPRTDARAAVGPPIPSPVKEIASPQRQPPPVNN
eukprot:TRINITY_DN1135_c0_g1_i2.p1 TRINITY_DN1135_c0_g1~~TRINITY_DN1135_c0_g1_i2.p1  ORF type:complete len:1082 (-),score=319.20 TRINITY_DN1135_c0_g1_i2:203-3448(-)